MSDTSGVSRQQHERPASPARNGVEGRQPVGEYVGQPAGDAAKAVRRAGLRPGLDRSFNCAKEQIGLVVAQQPPGGSELPRGGMVTLYVAAPGGHPIDADPPAEEDETTQPCSAPVPGAPERCSGGQAPASELPRRGDDAWTADSGAAPLHTDLQPPPEADAYDTGDVDDQARDDRGEDQARGREHFDRAEDLFREKRGVSPWSRAYPSRRAGLWNVLEDVRAWVARHRIAASALAALAAWVLVGAITATDHHPSTPGTPSVRRAATPARRATPARTPREAAKTHTPGPHTREGRPRRRQPEAASRAEPITAGTPPASAGTATADSGSATSEASATAAPPSEQSGGGLFSP